jgi:ribosome modulation factor
MDEIGFQMGILGRTKIVIPYADKNKYLQQPGDKSWASDS